MLHVVVVDSLDGTQAADDTSSKAASPDSYQLPSAAPQENVIASHATESPPSNPSQKYLEGKTLLALPPAEGTVGESDNRFCFHFNPEDLIQGDASRPADYNQPRVRSAGLPAGMIGAGVVTVGLVSSFIIAEATRQPAFKPTPSSLGKEASKPPSDRDSKQTKATQADLSKGSIARPELDKKFNPISLAPQMPPLPAPKSRPMVRLQASLPGLQQPTAGSRIAPAGRLQITTVAQVPRSPIRSTTPPPVASSATVAELDPTLASDPDTQSLASQGSAQEGLQLVAIQPADRSPLEVTPSNLTPSGVTPSGTAASNSTTAPLDSPIDRFRANRINANRRSDSAVPPVALAPRTQVDRTSRVPQEPLSPQSAVPGTLRSTALPPATNATVQPIENPVSPRSAWSEVVKPNSSSTLPQALQEFIALPQRLQQPVTSLPLTQQAAMSALRQQKVDRFSVLTLNDKDYLNSWKVTGQLPENETPVGLPAYGFIDYLRQLIIIPQAIGTVAVEPNL